MTTGCSHCNGIPWGSAHVLPVSWPPSTAGTLLVVLPCSASGTSGPIMCSSRRCWGSSMASSTNTGSTCSSACAPAGTHTCGHKQRNGERERCLPCCVSRVCPSQPASKHGHLAHPGMRRALCRLLQARASPCSAAGLPGSATVSGGSAAPALQAPNKRAADGAVSCGRAICHSPRR